MNSLVGSNQHESIIREENKTLGDGFCQRTHKLQRQERNDQEQQVQQKSANFKELLSFWQSGVLSSGSDNSQNMSASELPKTDSTTINQLQNVSVTGWPQDHRLKKTYSMNSLLGSKQHESIISQDHRLERMHNMNNLLESNQHESISREVNKIIIRGYGNRTDRLQGQESNDPENQYESAYVKELLSRCTSSYLFSELNSNRYTNASELPKTDSTQIQLQTSVPGKQTHHTLERMYLKNAFPEWNQYELTSREENKTRTDKFGQRSNRLQATSQQKVDTEQQIKQKSANESSLKLKRFFEQNRYQIKIMSELPKTDSTADCQRTTVPVTWWPQDHRPKIAFSTNVLPGSNQHEFKPVEVNKSNTGGYYNKTDRLQVHERNDQENQYQHEPVRVTESKSSFWASESLSPGLVRSQSMNALELSMADVTINQPQNVSVTGWQDHTLKRTYGRTVVPRSNQLETTSKEKNNERTGGYGERTDMLQRQESQDPEKQDQHEAAYVKELQSSLYTSSFLSSGLNSNQYSNASALPKTDTTQNQLLNLPVTCNWGPQNHTLKRANSMTFLPGSNYYESTSREENKTRTDKFGQRNNRLPRQQRDDPEQQIKQKSENIKENLLKWKSEWLSSEQNRCQRMNVSELPKTDSTAISQLPTVPETGWPQEQRLKRTPSWNGLLRSNRHESKPEVNKSRTGGYGNKTDILQGHERNNQENQYQHEPVRVKESKSSVLAYTSLCPGLIRSQSMKASELSMADVTINQLQNVSVKGLQDHSLKREHSANVVPGLNQLETASCKNTRNGEHKSTETDETIQENRRPQEFVRDSTSNNREIYKKCNTTPLHISSSKGFSHIVQDLIAKGANVNLCDDKGLSPLYLACFSEHTETVKILLGHRADVNNPSPLGIMCILGNSEIVRILLDNGANINLCDDKGRSPLFLACYGNHNEIVKILLDNGADVNISSPFRIRNAFRNAEIVQMLITNGADVSLCNDDDKDLYV